MPLSHAGSNCVKLPAHGADRSYRSGEVPSPGAKGLRPAGGGECDLPVAPASPEAPTAESGPSLLPSSPPPPALQHHLRLEFLSATLARRTTRPSRLGFSSGAASPSSKTSE